LYQITDAEIRKKLMSMTKTQRKAFVTQLKNDHAALIKTSPSAIRRSGHLLKRLAPWAALLGLATDANQFMRWTGIDPKLHQAFN
jgi:uncharacterized protein YbaP (TraB family)